ncbi:MAG: hypothetical protein NTV44_00410, partial [Firmicutes bacterium]|nr:hypothetical protein [Bacillota bacterium]
TAERIPYLSTGPLKKYTGSFYFDLAKSTSREGLFLDETLKKYGITNTSDNEALFLYEMLLNSREYEVLRQMGHLLSFSDVKDALKFSDEEVISFIALCSKARNKEGKALLDIRYHYFLRALDGCYLALDEPESLSLLRKKTSSSGQMMFEIAVCDD